MNVRLYHPVSGGEFDAAERAVEQWQRSGWVRLADWQAAQAQQTAPDGAAPGSASTAKANGRGPATTPEE